MSPWVLVVTLLSGCLYTSTEGSPHALQQGEAHTCAVEVTCGSAVVAKPALHDQCDSDTGALDTRLAFECWDAYGGECADGGFCTVTCEPGGTLCLFAKD